MQGHRNVKLINLCYISVVQQIRTSESVQHVIRALSFPWQQTEHSQLAQYQTKNIHCNEPSYLIRNVLHYNKHIQIHHRL